MIAVVISDGPRTKSSSLLATRDWIRPIARLGELGRAIVIPTEFLGANRASTPSISRVSHAVVDDPMLRAIRGSDKGRMANSVSRLARILIEDGVWVFPPVAWVHWVVAYKLKLPEAVVAVV